MWPFSKTNDDEENLQIKQAREEWQKRRSEENTKKLTKAEVDDYNYETEENNTGVWSERARDENLDNTPLVQTQVAQQRMRLNPIFRGIVIGAISFFAGFAVGSAHGATDAALRYRAENAHYVPNSSAGWYLYGKSRNYHSITGGVKQGIKVGGRFAGWSVIFVALEDGLDRARARIFARRDEVERLGQRDFLNTVSAAVAVVGINSRVNNLDRFAAMRSTKSALKFALPYGILQDFMAGAQGDPPWYAEWIFTRKSVTILHDPI